MHATLPAQPEYCSHFRLSIYFKQDGSLCDEKECP